MILLRQPVAFSRLLSGTRYFHASSACFATRKVLKKHLLSDIGEGIVECEVVGWSVKLHQQISAFDALCEVQSDKATVEITSPYDGIIKELLVKEGEVAKVGQGLCLIEIEEEVPEGAAVPSQVPDLAPHAAAEPTPTIPKPVAPVPAHASSGIHPMDPKYTPSVEDVLAAPSVRHFARKSGVNLALVGRGSGKDGRIEKVDVEKYLSSSAASAEAPSTTATPSAEDVVVELGRTRYGMWKAMTKSLEIPHFGYSTTLDLTALHTLLPTFNEHIPGHYLPPSPPPKYPPSISPSSVYPAPTPPDISENARYTRLTYLPILLKTLSKAMIEWPLFRSSITPSSDPTDKPKLTIRPRADISIALSTPTGLYTPTLQSVEGQSVYGLASSLKNLSHLGRLVPSGLSPKEMPKKGGTVTVSNVGAIGAGEFAMPVLVPGGGVAIVAIGRAKWVWDVNRGDGSGERRLQVGISWSADHRVVEGAELAAFVETWRGYVEKPERLIAEGI